MNGRNPFNISNPAKAAEAALHNRIAVALSSVSEKPASTLWLRQADALLDIVREEKAKAWKEGHSRALCECLVKGMAHANPYDGEPRPDGCGCEAASYWVDAPVPCDACMGRNQHGEET